jgi:hypothetical protein
MLLREQVTLDHSVSSTSGGSRPRSTAGNEDCRKTTSRGKRGGKVEKESNTNRKHVNILDCIKTV